MCFALFVIEPLIENLRAETYQLHYNIRSSRKLFNPLDVRAYLAEQAVMKVLRHYSFNHVKQFPDTWERNERGIFVNRENAPYHEFDEIGVTQESPVLIEVKAAKLNGFINKVPRAMELGKEVFPDQEYSLLVFFPFRYNKTKQIQKLEDTDGVYCIDTNWSRKAIGDAIDKFYRCRKNFQE